MSAFDSAMLMIDDLCKQVVELERKVWDLQLANWHASTFLDVQKWCSLEDCSWCKTHIKASVDVNRLLNDEV